MVVLGRRDLSSEEYSQYCKTPSRARHGTIL